MARNEIQERMTAFGAHIRDPKKIKESLKQARDQYAELKKNSQVSSVKDLIFALKNLDLCLVHILYLEAIKEYIEKEGQSRGSFLVLNPEGDPPCKSLGRRWEFMLNNEDATVENHILEISMDDDHEIMKKWVPIRPIPKENLWFENVWNDYLNDNIIKEVE
jgi:hypothetical protein